MPIAIFVLIGITVLGCFVGTGYLFLRNKSNVKWKQVKHEYSNKTQANLINLSTNSENNITDDNTFIPLKIKKMASTYKN